MRQGSVTLPVVDLHSDVMVDVYARRRMGERRVLVDRHLPRWRQGGVNVIVLTVGGDTPSFATQGADCALESTVVLLGELHREVEESGGELFLARSADEVPGAIDAGKTVLVPALEGCSALGEAEPVAVAAALSEAGVVSFGLTWNGSNQFACGAALREDGGLTALGRELLGLLEDRGVILDLAHASLRTFWDAFEATRGPLIVSHTASRRLRDHPRNIDDDQVRAVAGRGGLIGVCFYPAFLVDGGKARAEDVVRHVLHFLEVAGPEHVGIGADFIDYAEDIIGRSLRSCTSVDYGSVLTYPSGLEDVTRFGHLAELLRREGCSEDVVAAVMGGNFLRVWRTVGRERKAI
ncbi:MAG: membrane dipeptidase [Firmicutes bacterium]|nr:membrane dipeptidase [Bacillota bacterium]